MRKNLGQRSYPNDRNHHLPPMRGVAVLEEKDPLPSTQCHTTSDDGDGLAGAGHRHAQVAGRVIGPLHGVNMPVLAVGCDAVEKLVQVLAGGGIGIFENHETRAGVADKDRHDALFETGRPDDARHFVGDLVAAAAARAHFKNVGLRNHQHKLSTFVVPLPPVVPCSLPPSSP